MSTAPYLKTAISETEEARRLAWAVRILVRATDAPVSADTSRPGPAEAALQAGARLINDVRGLGFGERMARVAARADGVILMAHPAAARGRVALRSPAQAVTSLLKTSVAAALLAGVKRNRIALDPGLCFFRNTAWPWWKWDLETIRALPAFRRLGFPLLVGVSRKSFIGHLLGGKPAEERLSGSLAATAAAILNGAAILRTHDVAATRDAALVLEGLRRSR
jgi:dihydropteroate synthase